MNLKMENPATLATGRARNSFNVLPTMNNFDNSIIPSELKAHRASWLARRFIVSANLAELVASLALGEVRS